MDKSVLFSVVERLKAVRMRMGMLETRRPVTLIAVSKGQAEAPISLLLEEGQRDFGENRVQEAMAKWPALKRKYPDIKLHLIGPLQSNKVKDALALFDVIHTVDRESLAEALIKAESRQRDTRAKEFFIQVNTGEEPQKAGVAARDLPRLMSAVAAGRPSSLAVSGLMCIPPADEPPAAHFALLRKLAKAIGVNNLSMGMSGDYETAIRLGATHVRVGTAIFGERG